MVSVPPRRRARRIPFAASIGRWLAPTTFVLASAAHAAPGGPAPPSVEPPTAIVASEDFEPRPDDFSGPDWIQLTSGEWLQGDLDRIRDKSLDFDSDELDDLTFDFADVYAVVTGRRQTISFGGRQLATGQVAVRGSVVRIRTPDGITTFDRSLIVGMVPGTPRESNYWSGSISVGLSLQRGNTDQSEISALASLMRETALTRATAKYNGTLSTVTGQKTANNHRVSQKDDIFVTRRFYVTPLSFEYYTDEFQNIDYRLTPAAGIGYELIDRSRATVDVELAVGAQYTKNQTAAFPGEDTTQTSAAIIYTLRFDTDPTERIEWDGTFRVQLGVPETSETYYHALTTLSIDVWADLDLDLTFVWDRNQSPTIRQDSSAPLGFTIPLKNDYRLTAGLGWDF